MANAKGLSLRGGQRPTWRPEREARGSALGVQSRSTRLHRGKVTGEIATAFPRLPRRFAPRNDTSGGYCGAPAPSSGLIPLCKALNERRYRRNRSVRFYRHLVRTGSAFPRLPRRFAPRNDKSGAILILTVTCTNRQQCAGRGTPRLRDFHSIIIISYRPASASGSPCPDSSAAESHQSACPPAPWPPRRTGSGRRGGRSRAS